MTQPLITVDIAPGINPLTTPAPADWQPIASFVREIQINRGRNHELSRTQAGTATIRLRNTDRRFDPSNAAGPFYPNLVPMCRLRVRATHLGITYDIFQGFAENWEQHWPPRPVRGVGDAEVILHAVDAFKLLALLELAAYSNEVMADGPVGYWRLRETVAGVPAKDETSSPQPGTYTGNVTLNQPGPLLGGSGAPGFATSGYVSIGNATPLLITGDLTLEAWIYMNGTNDGVIISGGDRATPQELPYYLQTWGMDATTTKLRLMQGHPDGRSEQVSSLYAFSLNAWHHIAVTRQNAIIRFYVDGVLRDTVLAYGGGGSNKGATSRLDIGKGLGGYDPFWAGKLAQVAIYNKALSGGRIAAHYAVAMDTIPPGPSGMAINAILDDAGWPAGERVIDAGSSTMQDITPASGSGSHEFALDRLLAIAEDSERGLLSVQGDGRINFHARASLWLPPHDTNQAVFSDDPTTPGFTGAYADVVISYDDQDLWTHVGMQRVGGVIQEAEDPAAKAKYGPRTLEITGLLVASDLEMNDAANYLLGRFKTPRFRITSIVMEGGNDDALLPQLLGREIHADRVRVVRTPPGGGSPLVQDSHIEGVQHSIVPGQSWHTTWNLIPADATGYWILGVSQLGSSVQPTTKLGY